MPTYNLSKPILNRDGSIAKDANGKNRAALDCLIEALLSDYPVNDKPPAPAVKAARYRLWCKLEASDPASTELTLDEAKMLEEVAAAFPTVAYGQLLDILK